MKTRFGLAICLLLALLCPVGALAQLQLSLSGYEVAAESPVDFTVEGAAAPLYRYAVLRDDKKLFETESPLAFGSYLPRKEGRYTLRVSAGEEEAEADFAVVAKITCETERLSQQLRAGEPLKVHTRAAGGSGAYRYLYTVSCNDSVIVRQEGGESWHWVPAVPGAYRLGVTVMDSQKARAWDQESFMVEEGPGLSVEESGGGIYGHGGQKSWTVYTPEDWTAETTADFVHILTPQGSSGDVLTVMVEEAASDYREGILRIRSGGKMLEWTIAQPVSHGVDEEVFLFEEPAALWIEGNTHVGWMDARGSRSFAVDASAPWQAETQSSFIHVEAGEGEVTLRVDDSAEPTVRSGVVTLRSGSAAAYIHVYQPPEAQTKMQASTHPNVPFEEEDMTVYSQFSGLWKEKKYGVSTLEHSGCAIFALSHALRWLGFEGDAIQPEALAGKYAFCLRDGGTINSTLVGNAGDDLGFKTRYDLYKNLSDIRQKLDEGAVFSFAVVNGHIALAVEQSEDGSMLRILDSAPSATWERIKNARLYRREADGSFVPVEALTELDGARYYVENDAFGGLSYWLEAEYVAKRGVRLIQRRE